MPSPKRSREYYYRYSTLRPEIGIIGAGLSPIHQHEVFLWQTNLTTPARWKNWNAIWRWPTVTNPAWRLPGIATTVTHRSRRGTSATATAAKTGKKCSGPNPSASANSRTIFPRTTPSIPIAAPASLTCGIIRQAARTPPRLGLPAPYARRSAIAYCRAGVRASPWLAASRRRRRRGRHQASKICCSSRSDPTW